MKKIIFFLSAVLLQTAVINASEPYKAGDVIKDFSLKNVNDKNVSLTQFSDAKGFIVVFCCNTCPVVKKYQQRIIDLNTRFSKEGYPVIAINSNDKEVSPGDSFDEMKKFAREKGLQFEYLYDESQEVARLWGATNTPHVYVLSKKGDKLVVEYTGAIDNNADDPEKADKKYVVDAVNALLKNEPVAVVSTKAIGCSIKWKRS
jgi:peroxiredoxin